MKKCILFFFQIVFLFFFIPAFSPAVELLPYQASFSWILGQEKTVLCIEIVPDKGYYTYAPNQEDIYPTEIRLDSLSSEIPVLYPQSILKIDSIAQKEVQVFEGTVRIYVLFPKILTEGSVELSFLACSSERCQPLRIRKNFAEMGVVDFETFQDKKELYNLLFSYEKGFLAQARIDRAKKNSSVLTAEQEQSLQSQQQHKTEMEAAVLTGEAVQSLIQDNLGNFSLEALQEKAEDEENLQKNGQVLADGYAFAIQPFHQELEVQSIFKALLFGLLAGFILNFMPCVLPIVALKLHTFLGVHTQEDIQAFKQQMIFFALGILAWFAVLALLLGMLGFTWGQLFQEYWVMLFMCIVVFLLALSLLGVFHLPLLNLGRQQQKNPRADSFLSGFLATLLATPCSGPLLGGVLGYALTQPFYVVLVIFLCMGLGMAIPYGIFAVRPSLVRFMPRAGNWLLVMEKILAFFLVGTAIYLFSLLPSFLHIKTLIFIFALTVCLFIWGKWASIRLSGKRKGLIIAGFLIICTYLFVFLFIFPLYKEEKHFWTDFQKQEFLSQLGQKTLVLKFTADWCPTCKVLEKTVFTQVNMEKLSDQTVCFVLVDMTRFEKDKQELLASLRSASIPLLAVFPKNNPYQPYIIRDVYTFDTVYQALQKAMIE